MSRRGENIYKRKDKRWEGRYIKSRTFDGKPIFGYVYAKSYREVKEKLKNIDLNEAKLRKGNTKKFDVYSDEWLFLRKESVKEATYVKYYGIIYGHLKPFFGTCDPRQITEVMVGQFCQMLICEKELSPKTVRDILAVLRAVLTYIKKCSCVMRDIDIKYPREEQREMRVMSAEEQRIFIEYMLSEQDNIKRGILLALMTGMRIGELCALRWGDISLEDRTVHVSRTMQRIQIVEGDRSVKTKITIGEAKSIKSNRIIPLTDGAYEICVQLCTENPQAYILTGSETTFAEPRVIQYRLAKYTRACGLEGIHFHALRHTFATRCVEVGFEIKTLSEILGHSNTSVTLNRYVHSSMELKRANMDKLSAVGM